MFKQILAIFIIWRVYLFTVAYLATFLLPVFGNRFPYANTVLMPTQLPAWIWGFGNFDGVHYLRIAQNGYNAEFTQAFFPLYPLVISALNIIPKNPNLNTQIFVDPGYFITALILSSIFFLLSLFMFYKLLRLDYSNNIALGSIILLLVFPTSYYFGSVYTESFFLFLVVSSLFYIRKNNFVLAGLLGSLASATRIFGLLLIPVLLIEIFLKIKRNEINTEKNEVIKAVIGVLLIPFGTLYYMLFLKLNFDNPLFFLNSQPFFGAERTSETIILLPQVIYRYIKIFITVPLNTQLFLNALLEFIFTLIPLGVLIMYIKRLRLSYLVFTLGCLVIPTLTGTLSSMPRYSLMGFLLLPVVVNTVNKFYKVIALLFIVLGLVLIGFFTRGYWVA